MTYSAASIDEEEPELHEEVYSTRTAASGPVSFTVLAVRRDWNGRDGWTR